MTALTLTAKGQITLRQDLLRHLGITPKQQIQVHKLADGVLALHARKQDGMDGFIGCLPPPAKALSIEEMNEAIANAWTGRP